MVFFAGNICAHILPCCRLSCSVVSDVEACLPTWCECASQITILPLPLTVTPSLAGAAITLLTTAVSSPTSQYSLGCDGSCNLATIPSQAICVDNKSHVPTCPTLANILVNGACAAASDQDFAQTIDCINAPLGGSTGTTMVSSSFLSNAASATAVMLNSSTSSVFPTIISMAVQSTPYVNPNPYGCSSRRAISQDLGIPASITTMFCVCEGTTL